MEIFNPVIRKTHFQSNNVLRYLRQVRKTLEPYLKARAGTVCAAAEVVGIKPIALQIYRYLIVS